MTLAAILQKNDRDVVQVAPDMRVTDVVALLARHRIGAVPVVEGNRVIGIMSERDVVAALARDGAAMLDWPVERVMSRPAVTAGRDMSLLAALSLMTRRRFRHLPVLDGERMVGFVSIGDLVKARIDRIESEAEAMRAYIAA